MTGTIRPVAEVEVTVTTTLRAVTTTEGGMIEGTEVGTGVAAALAPVAVAAEGVGVVASNMAEVAVGRLKATATLANGATVPTTTPRPNSR